mmetsp:Transcript_19324/g.27781  ORF Transcript_19324/g.27781 Transcript_19324/m.27781 type:complete len:579 (+) Transcript_19324:222-1958(+)
MLTSFKKLVNREPDLYSTRDDIGQYKKVFETLGLEEKHVRQLFKAFQEIDFDDSRSISLTELMAYVNSDITSYTKRIFTSFDCDGSSGIDFYEFVTNVWDYCTLTKDNVVYFAFSLYDKDESGFLEKGEIENMLKDIYGDKYKESLPAKKLHSKLTELNTKHLDSTAFLDFSKKHPGAMYPAMVLQTNMRDTICGVDFWIDRTRKREFDCKGKYITLSTLLRGVARKIYSNDDDYVANEVGYVVCETEPPSTSSSKRSTPTAVVFTPTTRRVLGGAEEVVTVKYPETTSTRRRGSDPNPGGPLPGRRRSTPHVDHHSLQDTHSEKKGQSSRPDPAALAVADLHHGGRRRRSSVKNVPDVIPAIPTPASQPGSQCNSQPGSRGTTPRGQLNLSPLSNFCNSTEGDITGEPDTTPISQVPSSSLSTHYSKSGKFASKSTSGHNFKSGKYPNIDATPSLFGSIFSLFYSSKGKERTKPDRILVKSKEEIPSAGNSLRPSLAENFPPNKLSAQPESTSTFSHSRSGKSTSSHNSKSGKYSNADATSSIFGSVFSLFKSTADKERSKRDRVFSKLKSKYSTTG